MTTPYMTLKGTQDTTLEMNFGNDQYAKINFHRTLRIPDDNKTYGLPPSLGHFPLHQVEDYASKLPQTWLNHKGIFLPMYQSEALWMSFSADCPIALKIASGKINAISGKPWTQELIGHKTKEQQWLEDYNNHTIRVDNGAPKEQPDYIVIPKQPWIDGFNVGKGLIKQFVAVPMGKGYTVEEQLTGKAEHGGIQIIAYPMKKDAWEKIKAQRVTTRSMNTLCCASMESATMSGAMSKGILRNASVGEMGLGQGGFMKQDIYADEYGLDVWDTTKPLRIFVHLVNSLDYEHITGHKPHQAPLGPKDYALRNYPWFDYYSEGEVLEGSKELSKVDSIGSLQIKNKENILGDNSTISEPYYHTIGSQKVIKNGNW